MVILWHTLAHFQCILYWRHNERDGVPNHQSHDCLFNCLFRCRSKKTSKLRVTGLCAGKSQQMASNAENVSIQWRHHVVGLFVFSKRYFVACQIRSKCMLLARNGQHRTTILTNVEWRSNKVLYPPVTYYVVTIQHTIRSDEFYS